MKSIKYTMLLILSTMGLTTIFVYIYYFCCVPDSYEEMMCQTPNITPGKNLINGVVLHHTATFTPQQSVRSLTSPSNKVSCHVIVSYDGTRIVLANPSQITWHAGRAYFNGKTNVNRYTIGVEFQGCTLYFPLTNRTETL